MYIYKYDTQQGFAAAQQEAKSAHNKHMQRIAKVCCSVL